MNRVIKAGMAELLGCDRKLKGRNFFFLPVLSEASHSPASRSAAVRSNLQPSDWQPPSGFSPHHNGTSGLRVNDFKKLTIITFRFCQKA